MDLTEKTNLEQQIEALIRDEVQKNYCAEKEGHCSFMKAFGRAFDPYTAINLRSCPKRLSLKIVNELIDEGVIEED